MLLETPRDGAMGAANELLDTCYLLRDTKERLCISFRLKL